MAVHARSSEPSPAIRAFHRFVDCSVHGRRCWFATTPPEAVLGAMRAHPELAKVRRGWARQEGSDAAAEATQRQRRRQRRKTAVMATAAAAAATSGQAAVASMFKNHLPPILTSLMRATRQQQSRTVSIKEGGRRAERDRPNEPRGKGHEAKGSDSDDPPSSRDRAGAGVRLRGPGQLLPRRRRVGPEPPGSRARA